jgi:hypothetical protein
MAKKKEVKGAVVPAINPTLRTTQEFETYYAKAKEYVKPWHENIKGWRRWYNFDHYDKKPLPNEERYPDPTPTNTVDLATGILLAKDVEFRAQGWKRDINAESDSSRVEKFLAGTLYVNNEREELNLTYEATLQLVRDGATVLYTVWDKNIAQAGLVETQNEEGQPIQVLSELPLRLQVVDPLQIYMLPGGPKRWQHVIREWEMTVSDVEARWGKKIRSMNFMNKRDKMFEKVKVKDYWRIIQKKVEGQLITVVEQALIAHDEVIWPLREMEGYDDLPYTIGFFKPVDRDDPKGWHGILRPLESTVRHLENAFNRRARQLTLYSALPLISRTIPHRRVRMDPALGNIVPLGLEESIEFPTWPGNAPDVERHIGFLRARLQQAGFSDVMFGEGASQVSGFALSQLGDQNQIRLAQPVIHLEMMWGNWARKALKLTAFFTEGETPIRIYGNLKGQDFIEQLATDELHTYMVKASVRPEFPNEKTRNHAMANQVRDILSERTIMDKYLDIDQPDEERERRLDDMAMSHPAMIEFDVRNRLMELAQSEDPMIATAAGMAIQQMQGGPQGGGGGGRESISREQAIGLQSATGDATEQAGGAAPPGQGFADVLQGLTESAPGLT